MEGTSVLGVAVGVARVVGEVVAEELRLGAALFAGWEPQAESIRLRVRPVIVTALQSLKRLDVMFLVPPERRVIAQRLPLNSPHIGTSGISQRLDGNVGALSEKGL